MYHNHIKNLFNVKSFTRKNHWRLYQILFRFRQRHYNNLQVAKYTVLSFKMRIPPFPNDPQFSYFCPNISLWPTSRQWHVCQTLSEFFKFNLFYSASNMFRHQALITYKHPDQSELIGLFLPNFFSLGLLKQYLLFSGGKLPRETGGIQSWKILRP